MKPTRSYFALLDTCESVKGYNIRKRPAPSKIGDGKVFRKFHYATCRASLSLNSVLEQICLDSGCTMTIGDREWIKKLRPDLEIHRMKDPITVRAIGTAKYPTDEYVILNIYMPGLVNGKVEVVQITAEVHLVRSLKARLLIGVDVLDSEGMDISFRDRSLTVNGEEGWKTSIHVHAKDNTRVRCKVRALKQVTVPPHSSLAVPITLESALPTDRDFLFTPTYPGVHTHLVDADMRFVHIRNDADRPLHVDPRNGLGKIAEMEEEHCYLVSEDSHGLAALNLFKSGKDGPHPATDNEDVVISYGMYQSPPGRLSGCDK